MPRFGLSAQILGFILWMIVCFTTAAVGAVASVSAAQFYAGLEQPFWAPGPGVFAPVWSALYAMMAMAAWLVWRVGGFRSARTGLLLFLAQLAVNALWSWLFFVWHLGALAFLDTLLLIALILTTLREFQRHQPVAVLLMLPYLAWVSFAAVLNLTVWLMNPQAL